MMKLLEGVLDDPDKRITARKDLRKLTMKPFGDFNSFLADYTKLANESRFELDQWKEDFHDKLYDNLRVQMEIYLDDETVTFDQYCGFAKAYARGLSSKESNRKERSGDNANSPKGRRGGGTAGIAPRELKLLLQARPPQPTRQKRHLSATSAVGAVTSLATASATPKTRQSIPRSPNAGL